MRQSIPEYNQEFRVVLTRLKRNEAEENIESSEKFHTRGPLIIGR